MNIVLTLNAKALVKIRSELGVTQERMASLLGVSFVSVNRWEKGHSAPLAAVSDIYRAIHAALRAGHSSSTIIAAATGDRGQFLFRLFTMAYGQKAAAR